MSARPSGPQQPHTHAVRTGSIRTVDFMVAPEVRTSGLSSCAAGALQLLVFAVAVAQKTMSAETDFLPFPGERPSAAEAKEWIKKAKAKFTDDEVAMINGAEPSSLLTYAAA